MILLQICQNLCIEGIPVIIRFKTITDNPYTEWVNSIEGIPLRTRFKTYQLLKLGKL